MLPKSGKKTSQRTPKHSLKELEQREQQRRRAYQELVESIQILPPLQKAEAWLKHVSGDIECYGDQEAVVYLVSRGQDCSDGIRQMVADWATAKERTFNTFKQGISYANANTGKTRRIKPKSFTTASGVSNYPTNDLPNFWEGYDSQEDSIDATMLRTVEWCHIGGFDEWWLRLAREQYESITHDGVEPWPAIFYLFSLCRSDYAMKLMDKALLRMLEAVELADYQQVEPWCRWRTWLEKPQATINLAYAASLSFADKRLRPDHGNTALVASALETLLKYQDAGGGWRCWVDDAEPSVEITAMVLHALAMHKPRGWELAASLARDWLWSVQHRDGCWTEPGSPDNVYLTVLVLDALELANGGSSITFGHPGAPPGENLPVDKIKVLFLAANPRDTPRLRLDEQIRLITERVRAAEYRDSMELISAWAVRADDLLQVLNVHKPHIVHFSGHGSRTGEILAIGDQGQAMPISTKALKALFKTLRDNIRVVILDACYSQSQAQAITDVVDCAIGMADAIGDTAATIFTAAFYRAIGFGRSVQDAFDQGKAALLLENIPEENTPQLLTRIGVDPSKIYLISGLKQ